MYLQKSDKGKQSTIESTTKIYKVIAEATQRNNSHLIICGDFNYPCIDWEHEFVEEHTDVIKPFIKTIQTYSLAPTRIQNYYMHQHVFEPTRFKLTIAPTQFEPTRFKLTTCTNTYSNNKIQTYYMHQHVFEPTRFKLTTCTNTYSNQQDSNLLLAPTRIRTNKIQRRTRTKRAGPCVQERGRYD